MEIESMDQSERHLPMNTLWENRSRDICFKKLGASEFNKRIQKSAQASHGGILSSKALLSMVGSSKAKKMVANSGHNILRRCHGVGAVGYAVVELDDRVPANDFFVQGRRFRVRFRHSNVNCDDDAGACQREAAIKFADRNEDGPLDLILFTGRTALARNGKGLGKVLKLTKPDDIRCHCFEDPNFYFSLVDGLRRAPSSFTNLTYYSQMPYQFTTKDGEGIYVARFRLIPGEDGVQESGLLTNKEQEQPWETGRRMDDKKDASYLRDEFIVRLKQDEPVQYVLQMQLAPATDIAMWDPQKILKESHPWLNVMKIQLTTFLPSTALRQTFFNIVEKPKCLQFPSPSSMADPLSYQKLWSRIYTEFELKRKRQMSNDNDDVSKELVTYNVSIQTKALKDGRVPPVDIAITLAGTDCRSAPRSLVRSICHKDHFEHYAIEAEDVGELLAVIVSVKYRQLAEDWYLREVKVCAHPNENKLRRNYCFPSHKVVTSKTTLRRGEAYLSHKESFEIHRQERRLDLSQKQEEYEWQVAKCAPSQIKGRTVQDIPPYERQRANKYKGVVWQIDQDLINFYLNLRSTSSSSKSKMAVDFESSTVRSTSSFQSPGAMLSRQLSSQAGQVEADFRRRACLIRQLSVDVVAVYQQDGGGRGQGEGTNKALLRWKKVKQQVKVISESRIPEGSKGEMCREVQNDVDFGRIFLCGINPTMIRRCRIIPEKFPVTNDMVSGILDRRLEQELEDGNIYLADYSLLADIQPIHRDADHRYMVAPLVLFYVRNAKDLIPIAIQLNQAPDPTNPNPIWTPSDKPEQWMLAKLWVRCANFHWGFAIAHIFRCHILMEPFVIATMRQLSTAHPVYKLLKPYFRYTLATNTLMRNNVYKKGTLLDRFTSLGTEGFQTLIHRYWEKVFSFEELDPIKDFKARDVENLPKYFYRDDTRLLWESLSECCRSILHLFYETPEDVVEDKELRNWINELNVTGFNGLTDQQQPGLPKNFNDVDEVADLVTKIIFTLTCQHSATHSDFMDFHGFVPDIPAMMRMPPPNSRDFVVDRDVLTKTLPDQYPDAYYGTLAIIMLIQKPDESVLSDCDEVYFTEREVLDILKDFQKSMEEITKTRRARNIIEGYQYESLMPSYIPTSAEPLPFVQRSKLTEMLQGLSPTLFREVLHQNTETMLPLMTMALSRQFSRVLGGRSTTSRRLTMTIVKGMRDSKKDPRASAAVAAAAAAVGIEEEEDEWDGNVAGPSNFEKSKQPMRGSRISSSNF